MARVADCERSQAEWNAAVAIACGWHDLGGQGAALFDRRLPTSRHRHYVLASSRSAVSNRADSPASFAVSEAYDPNVTDKGGKETPEFLCVTMYAEDIAPLRAYYHEALGLPIDYEEPDHLVAMPKVCAHEPSE